MGTVITREAPYVGINTSRWVAGRMLYSNGEAAGVHTVAIEIPAYSFLLNVGFHAVALWDQGTSAAMVVGDGADADGFIASTDMKATDCIAGESIWIGQGGTSMAGGKVGAYIASSQWTPGSGASPQFSTASRVVTFTLTTVGTAATTGETYCLVEYLTFSGREPITTGTYAAT